MIPIYAEEIRREHDQVPQATFCTAIWTEFDCERKTNCYWEETVCLANRVTSFPENEDIYFHFDLSDCLGGGGKYQDCT